MYSSQIYIVMVIVALALIAVLLSMLNKNMKEVVISPLPVFFRRRKVDWLFVKTTSLGVCTLDSTC